jgi:twitching motility protein PilT
VARTPLYRVHGIWRRPSADVLSAEDTEGALKSCSPTDEAGGVRAGARGRLLLRNRGRRALPHQRLPAARGDLAGLPRDPAQDQTIEELALPSVVKELAEEERGIVLLTGTTGSGKSTTLAAMIDHMNDTTSKHIVTIEDPIEFVHSDKRSVINQREVGMDTASFKRALRRVLRQDPDVILIGEMRDEETVQTALSAAETGHLVLSTIHTVDATESINRMLDFFPPTSTGRRAA